MKKITALAMLAALTLALPGFGVRAVDTSYSGYLDARTNEPLTTEQQSSESNIVGGRTQVSGNCFYDWNTHDYVYTSDDSLAEIHASVVDGMVVNVPVNIIPGSNAALQLYLDGEAYDGELTAINDPGVYIVSLQQGGATARLFSFTIVGEQTNLLNRYVVPDGFYITSAFLGDEDINTDFYVVDMEEEGTYEIEYECIPTDIRYSLKTTVDRTPPQVELSGHTDKRGRYRSAVTFSGLEEGDDYVLTREGENVTARRNVDLSYTVYDSGNYRLRVYDKAGNFAEHDFLIMLYFNASSLVFFTLVVVTAAAVLGYIIYKRRHLRIG